MKKAGFIIVAIGLLLHAHIAFFEGKEVGSTFLLALMVWSWLPYLVSLRLILLVRRPLIPLCGVIPPLVMDAFNYYEVFISPTSSTAAINLLFMPLWNLVLFMPIGLLVGWWVTAGEGNSGQKTSNPPTPPPTTDKKKETAAK